MAGFLIASAIVILGSMGAGMYRVLQGPTPEDRMLAALLSGTSGVALLLILAEAVAMPALKDVALVLVVLATVTTVAFVRLKQEPMPIEGRRLQETGEE